MSERESWIEVAARHEATFQPYVDRAVEAGADPGTIKYLAQTAGMQRYIFENNNPGRETAYASFEEFVLKHGEVFEAPPTKKPRPKGFRKGRDKMCFMNSTHAAFEHGWSYVEGFGTGYIPAHHAWVVDDDGNVVETTWKQAGSTYFGVKFSDEQWRLSISLTGVYGVMNAVLMEQPYTPEGHVAALRAALAEKRRAA